MALTTYLLQKNRATGPAINGCHAMLHTIDPAVTTTAALRLAAAIALAQTAMGPNITLPSNYFDVTEQALGASSGGYLPALGDNIVFARDRQIITIA